MIVRCGRSNLSWDAAHRVLGHESKCRALHGHRYSATIIAEARDLDDVGRVVDFGVIKRKIGSWIDLNFDHAVIVNPDDELLLEYVRAEGIRKPFVMPQSAKEPTAENIAHVLYIVARDELQSARIRVVEVTVYETPNCFATVSVKT